MNWIKKCPVLFLLAVSGFVLTIAGIAGKNSIYKGYDYHIMSTPFLALTIEGLDKGVYPWEAFSFAEQEPESSDKQELTPEAAGERNAGQSIEMFENPEGSGGANDSEDTAGNGGTDGEYAVGNHSAAGGHTAAAGGRTYAFETVTEEYFRDAVFIGDSRTVGLFEYSGLADYADFYAQISLTIYDVFTDLVVKDEETGKKITIEEALKKKQYGKVYLMLGINELGTGTVESFMKEYGQVVDRLKALQPDAVIFVEGIMRVTGSKNETDAVFNNGNINARNEEIKKLADNISVFYIDVNEVVCDAQGNLNTDYTIDEIHLKAQYYEIWKQFLLEHGVVRTPAAAR